MKITTLSSTTFNQDVAKAKEASNDGPVIITDRGRPTHVLLSMKDYLEITGQNRNMVELLAMPGPEDIDFEPSRFDGDLSKSFDLS